MSMISSCVSKFSFLWAWKPSCRHCPDFKFAQGYLHASLCLTQIATLDCEFQQHLLSLSPTLSPCCHSFLKSLMLGCPLHPILLLHVSKLICTGVLLGCVVREEKGVLSKKTPNKHQKNPTKTQPPPKKKPKQKTNQKKSEFRQTLQQIQHPFKKNPQTKTSKQATKQPKPTQTHNNQEKTKRK